MTKTLLTILLVASLAVGLGSRAGAGTLIGWWTFDSSGARTPVQSHPLPVQWYNIQLNDGARIENNKLIIPRGAAASGCASVFLKNELGAGSFKEFTLAAWIEWPAFDPNQSFMLMNLNKLSADTFAAWNIRDSYGVYWRIPDLRPNVGWVMNPEVESFADGKAIHGGPWLTYGPKSDPPANKRFLVAVVAKQTSPTTYTHTLYADYGDGLTAKGSFDLPAASEWAFGQCGSQSLIAGMPADNPRWDCVSFDAYTWKYPASQNDLMFDEVRLYSGALSPVELSALKPGH